MAEQATPMLSAPAPLEVTDFLHELGAQADMSLVPLQEGCHNKVYFCENGPSSFPPKLIVRTPTCPEAARAIEASASYLKDTPAPQTLLIGWLATSGAMIAIEEFIEGEHKKDLNTLTSTEVTGLASSVARVHEHTSQRFSDVSGGAPRRYGTYGDYLQAMLTESVESKLPRVPLEDYIGAEQLITAGVKRLHRVLDSEQKLFGGNQFCLLHHDLNPSNMLWRPDGSVRFIDWNATFGDAADDVDYVITNNETGPRFNATFLEEYMRITKRHDIVARVGAYTLKNQLDDLVWIIDMRTRFADDPKFGPASYARRFSALENTLSTLE